MKFVGLFVENGSWLVTFVSCVVAIQVPVTQPVKSSLTNGSTLLVPTSTETSSSVGEAPDISSTGSAQVVQLSKDVDDGLLLDDITTSSQAPFPENHKKSPNEVSSLEVPPYLHEYNKYQQQYREYLAQKSHYAATAKPVKFEDFDGSNQNRYLTDGLSAFGDDNVRQTEVSAAVDPAPRHKPFPYLFQNEISNLEPPEPSAYPIPDNNLIPSAEFDSETEAPSFLPSFLSSPLATFFTSQLPKEHKQLDTHGHRSEVHLKSKTRPAWKKIVKVLSTVLPLGLFLATLAPNLIYINSTAEDSKPSRVRSREGTETRQSRLDDVVDPLVELVHRFGGLEAMMDPECEDRFFCEMSVLGHKEDSNLVERGFWYLANETPSDIAAEVGMTELFNAIKKKSCDVYKCAEKIPETKSTEMEEIFAETGAKQVKKEKTFKKVKKFIRSR